MGGRARNVIAALGAVGSAGKDIVDRLSRVASNPANLKTAEKVAQRGGGVLGQSTGSIPFSRGPVVEMEKAAIKQVNKALFKPPTVEAGDLSPDMYRDTSGDDEFGRPSNMQPPKDDDFHSGFDDAMKNQAMKRRTGSNSGSSD